MEMLKQMEHLVRTGRREHVFKFTRQTLVSEFGKGQEGWELYKSLCQVFINAGDEEGLKLYRAEFFDHVDKLYVMRDVADAIDKKPPR